MLSLIRKRANGSASPHRARLGRDVAARLDANPAVTRAKAEGARIYYHPGFFSDAECDLLIARIDANRRPSTLLRPSNDPEYRTSDSCDLDRWAPDIRPLDERIAHLIGIEPSWGETMQGQRYGIGQQFRAHCDWFFESEEYWPAMKANGGQRTWTAMAYLNDVPEGGATWFPHAGLRVKPRRGLLLVWDNMNPDGSPNRNTLHEAMAVFEGTKYVVTKWFREEPWVRSSIQTY